ncbi:copper resistance system multicopper oxidase [Pokkaliibacter sp. CJK22405]|uniref:copper resistance system multicopper oxidase n=1 Tax=Pokkaliibacter sp. CJK22405 TaxID=3384615 RepID=UPI0039854805
MATLTWQRWLRRVPGLLAVVPTLALSGTYDLTIDQQTLTIDGKAQKALTINGSVPGPTLRFREGEEVTINVTNHLKEDTSLHWHGLILPADQDGVPGFSGFKPIQPGQTFTYRFPLRQSGTYWYHSHSGFQEQDGIYGALIIDPAGKDPIEADRDYVVMLSDWAEDSGATIFRNLKRKSDYYNNRPVTLGDFFAQAKDQGFGKALDNRLAWGQMRMMDSDISDVSSGYTYLINGKSAADNWTGLFQPGERVRLRLINASAMSYFDVRIPGLKMTVVQADGNQVEPVSVDELRIAVAETYDVIVEPTEDKAYTLFAQTVSRGGFARATLAPRAGMTAKVPDMSPVPVLTMADMGMSHGMGHGAMNHGDMAMDNMAGMDHSTMDHSKMNHGDMAMDNMASMDHSTMDHSNMNQGAASRSRESDYAPGSGLEPKAANGGIFLVYGDLKAVKPFKEYRQPDREIELRLTGNMERYIWSINGIKYTDAEPLHLTLGERVRIRFVNDTMMMHPMHLHGMWMQLDKGKGAFNPLKHIVNVAPGTTLTVDVPVDAVGEWAFHCHLMYHMAAGMFRKIIVDRPGTAPTGTPAMNMSQSGEKHVH